MGTDRQERERKGKLFVDNMTCMQKIPNNPLGAVSINKLSEVTQGRKAAKPPKPPCASTQQQRPFQHCTRRPSTISPQITFRHNFNKLNVRHTVKQLNIIKEIRDEIIKGKNILCTWTKMPDTVKMTIPSKLTYRFSVTPISNLAGQILQKLTVKSEQ